MCLDEEAVERGLLSTVAFLLLLVSLFGKVSCFMLTIRFFDELAADEEDMDEVMDKSSESKEFDTTERFSMLFETLDLPFWYC